MQQIGKIIGRRKYDALKSLDLENLNDDNLNKFNTQFKNITVGQALKMIKNYEAKYTHLSKASTQKTIKYFEDLNKPKPKKELKMLDKQMLWRLFNQAYITSQGKPYATTSQSLENIKPLMYYFLGDLENFRACSNVSKLSPPSLNKGLLIIGGYGNGKTTVMRALEVVFKRSNISFKGYTANGVVERFEACAEDPNKNEKEKTEFWRTMNNGVRWFDDVLTEREASNYGKVNLFKDILEKRQDLGQRTYITLNYKDNTNNDLEQGLSQLGEKYGGRVYDRIFSMFNIIEFKGKSQRGNE